MISLPLSEYLDLLWRYKDKAYVNKEVKLRIEAELDHKALCHLEPGGNTKDESGLSWVASDQPSIWTVWRRKEWEMAYVKWLDDKHKADVRVAEHNLKKEQIDRLVQGIVDKLGVDAEDAKEMAAGIVKKQKWEFAEKMFGVKLI